jgi:uncharacterized protein (TIGR02246 family)
LLGTGGLRADVIADVTAASDSAHATVITALQKSDGAKLASVFTGDGAVITPYGQSFEGRLTIRATATLMLTAFGSGKLTITRQSISVVDGVPYETGQYRFTRRLEKNRTQRYTGRYTLIWKREDGVWKVYRAIGIR